MVFLKALTILIISISISKIIFSISRTDDNEKNKTLIDVHVWGLLKCEFCGGNDVLINLKKDGVQIDHFYGNCSKIFDFNTNTTKNISPLKLTADFIHYCKNKTTWINDISSNCTHLPSEWYEFYDCRFGVVEFKNSKREQIVRD